MSIIQMPALAERAEVVEPRNSCPDAPPEFSDEALALRFAELHCSQLRYVATWTKWMVYDGAKWASDETRLAYSLARVVCREASALCDSPKTSVQIASAKTRHAVITLANDDRRLAATSEQWDENPNTLNTPKGSTIQ